MEHEPVRDEALERVAGAQPHEAARERVTGERGDDPGEHGAPAPPEGDDEG